VAPGGVELVEPIWSWLSSSLALPLCGVSNEVDGMAAVRGGGDGGDGGGGADSEMVSAVRVSKTGGEPPRNGVTLAAVDSASTCVTTWRES
jgi:hypothetical protein